MKHIQTFPNTEALEDALHEQTLETPYVCAVSDSLDFNSKQPIFSEGGAADFVPVRTFDGGGAASEDSSTGVDGSKADKFKAPGRTLRSKWKL